MQDLFLDIPDGFPEPSIDEANEIRTAERALAEWNRRERNTYRRPNRNIGSSVVPNADAHGCAGYVRALLAQKRNNTPSKKELARQERKRRELETSGLPTKLTVLTPSSPYGEPQLFILPPGRPLPRAGDTFTYMGHRRTVRFAQVSVRYFNDGSSIVGVPELYAEVIAD